MTLLGQTLEPQMIGVVDRPIHMSIESTRDPREKLELIFLIELNTNLQQSCLLLVNKHHTDAKIRHVMTGRTYGCRRPTGQA